MSSPVSSLSGEPQRRFDAAFSREFELLLACCVLRPDVQEHEIRALLGAVVDWPSVVRLGEHHNVLPLLYQALRHHADSVPSTICEELRARYEANARKNLKFTGELFRILDCLETEGIAALPYKGPILAEIVYGDLALREFSDLDILVRPRDVLRAKSALEALGYRPGTQLSDAVERAYLATGYELAFDGPAGRNLLEIQWNIVPRFYAVDFSIEAFFERATSTVLGGRTVQNLSPEDLFLTSCVHAAKHAWIRLCWLRDIAGVLESQQLDWKCIAHRVRDLGIAGMVGVSLLLAHRLLSASLPDSWRHLLQGDSEIEGLCAAIARLMARAEQYNPESPAYFDLMIRLRERVSDKLRLLFRLALTPGPGEWNLVQLPARLFPLYRVIRVFRLASRFAARGPQKL